LPNKKNSNLHRLDIHSTASISTPPPMSRTSDVVRRELNSLRWLCALVGTPSCGQIPGSIEKSMLDKIAELETELLQMINATYGPPVAFEEVVAKAVPIAYYIVYGRHIGTHKDRLIYTITRPSAEELLDDNVECIHMSKIELERCANEGLLRL